MAGFKTERIESRVDDCSHCPARGVPCLVMSVYVRELGECISEVRVNGAVAVCHRCVKVKVASHG